MWWTSPGPTKTFQKHTQIAKPARIFFLRTIPNLLIKDTVNSRSPNNTVEMAPTKKNKKDANSINSKLALVMKSGKGKQPRRIQNSGASRC